VPQGEPLALRERASLAKDLVYHFLSVWIAMLDL
jgi:hypothetical protein